MSNISTFVGTAGSAGGGGGVGVGQLAAIPQDGTHTNDQTTNFIIDYNGGTYLRTGITITSSQDSLAYSNDILPINFASSVNSEIDFGTGSIANYPFDARYVAKTSNFVVSESFNTGVSGAGDFSDDSRDFETLLNHTDQSLRITGYDDEYLYVHYAQRTNQGGTHTPKIYSIRRSTGEFVTSSIRLDGVSSNLVQDGYLRVLGADRGAFRGKVLVDKAGININAYHAFIVLNTGSLEVDTSFNTGVFSNGYYETTGNNPFSNARSGTSGNSNAYTGWMLVNNDLWNSTSNRHLAVNASDNISLPAGSDYTLRYISFAQAFNTNHQWFCIDWETASLIASVNSTTSFPFRYNLLDGTKIENGSTSVTFNVDNWGIGRSNTSLGLGPAMAYGNHFQTAAEATASLSASTALSTYEQHNFTVLGTYGDTIATSPEGTSRGYERITQYLNFQDGLFPDSIDAYDVGTQSDLMESNLIIRSGSGNYLHSLIESVGYTLRSTPSVAEDNGFFLVRTTGDSGQTPYNVDLAQGYLDPMYLDIRDNSVAVVTTAQSSPNEAPRTEGLIDNHNTQLTDGDNRSKYRWPIWVRIA